MKRKINILNFAQIDLHRFSRKGFPEVIFCQGKTKEQILKIAQALKKHNQPILATRANEAACKTIQQFFPQAIYHAQAKAITIGQLKTKAAKLVLILSAGTADQPVVEEAKVTGEFLGLKVETVKDVGVAGIHRLLNKKVLTKIKKAAVIIVVAGMEGALASVVAGLTDKPVIAVPTSIGYGANFKGLSALLCMLNCCSPGVATVNIDNGFGAACLAFSIIKLIPNS